MKFNLSAILVIVTLSTKAQTGIYHPFPDSNAYWNISFTKGMCNGMGGWDYENYCILFSGDTLIGNKSYHKIYVPYIQKYITGTCTQTNFKGYKGAIRQEIENKKVFFVPPSGTENLLYDFNLNVGDTLKGYIRPNWGEAKVIAIDSVMVGSEYRKRWKFYSYYNTYMIEGVGFTYGLIQHYYPVSQTDADYYSIFCFNQNGQTLYPIPGYSCTLITSSNLQVQVQDPVRVYPNPSHGPFVVELSGSSGIIELQISDLTGKIFWRKQIRNESLIKIDKLTAGVYILTSRDIENRTTNRKLLSCP
jgi:hypothetical protein